MELHLRRLNPDERRHPAVDVINPLAGLNTFCFPCKPIRDLYVYFNHRYNPIGCVMSSTRGSSHEGSMSHPPRRSTDSENSIMSIEGSISDLVGNSMEEMKRRVWEASDSVQSAWAQLRSMVTGKESHNEDKPDREEMRRINSMEKEKVAEFLRYKHRSDAHSRVKRP
ncbi:hypothetical protein BDV59DRAFT_76018 [Aspergillus ambiguus]|uniref:uncharacterized protein n=1 Tax=Aspergillus ambiguus TaxID=176160 RepID=UPI003CCDC102